MINKRAKELAKITVDYSANIKRGEVVLIEGEVIAAEFMCEIARLVIDKGAYPIVDTVYPNERRYFLENAAKKQLVRVLKSGVHQCREIDANICVDAEFNPKYLEGVNPKRIASRRRATKIFNDIIIGDGKKNKGKKWVMVAYPTEGSAKIAGMSFKRFEKIIYNATNINWRETTKQLRRVKKVFDNAKEVRILNPGTDLTFSLKGRGGDMCDGKFNMPDGEVYYGPVEDSMNGEITFSYPAIRDGNEVEGIHLEFYNGRIKTYSAKKNVEFLRAMLELKGADRVGEFGIGCNYGIKRYMKNLLFDEKIGGTIHLALGDAYKEPLSKGGGLNKSDIHWDIVCDLRKDGTIYVDNNLVQKNGRWTF